MRSSMRVRTSGGAAGAVLALLVLTGCGSQANEPTASPTVTVAPSTSAPSTSAAPTPTGTPSSSPSASDAPTVAPTTQAAADPGRPSGQCADSDLGVGIKTSPGGGGLGSSNFDLIFTNTGGESCELRGTPGVSVVAGSGGDQVGPPADRPGGSVKTLTLQAGDTVYAHLRVTNLGSDGSPLQNCTVVQGRGYRVYPPHSKKAFFVEASGVKACQDGPVFMSVDAVSRTAV